MNKKEAVILIGHGAAASDTPRPIVEELKKLEMQRQRNHEMTMSAREMELDRLVREWPRTPQNDPYKAGLELIARSLESRISGRKLVLAYNEFCSPSVEEAIAGLVREGYGKIVLATTMYTRGGLHSELEIPAITRNAQQQYPGVEFVYAWPFNPDQIADFLVKHINSVLSVSVK